VGKIKDLSTFLRVPIILPLEEVTREFVVKILVIALVYLVSKRYHGVVDALRSRVQYNDALVRKIEDDHAGKFHLIHNPKIRAYLEESIDQKTPFHKVVKDLSRMDGYIPAVCLFHTDGHPRTLHDDPQIADISSIVSAFAVFYPKSVFTVPEQILQKADVLATASSTKKKQSSKKHRRFFF
jgi:hypothetical protein